MFRFLKDVLGATAKQSNGFDSTLTASGSATDSNNNGFVEPMRIKRDMKVTRALSRKATRMKLERILEKVEKQR